MFSVCQYQLLLESEELILLLLSINKQNKPFVGLKQGLYSNSDTGRELKLNTFSEVVLCSFKRLNEVMVDLIITLSKGPWNQSLVSVSTM